MKYAFKQALIVCASATMIVSGHQQLIAAESLAQQASKDFTTVAKKAIPAVVSIQVKSQSKGNASHKEQFEDSDDLFGDDFLQRFFSLPKRESSQPSFGQASGFIISADGLILTNSHVVKDAFEIQVTLNDGREFSGKIMGQDPNTDIALVKIEAAQLPYLQLGNSDNLEIGEWVIAIGNTLGLQATLTVGVVSAKGRSNLALANVEDFIQTDAAINRGNSGGPLLNLSGEVIGMNTAIATSSGSGGYVGIGFAIPSNLIKHIMEELLATGTVTRGYIGVTLQPIDQDLAQALDLKQLGGALVANVAKDSPAEKAGLKQGDVIQSYNKLPVANIASLRNAIVLMPPGKKVNLTILRNGTTMDVAVEVGAYPTTPTQTPATSGNQFGFEVQELTPDLAKALGVSDEKGVVINHVEANSPAAWAGLKKGILILAVNRKEIHSIEEFNKALQDTPKDRPVLLLVKQGDMIRFISLRVAK